MPLKQIMNMFLQAELTMPPPKEHRDRSVLPWHQDLSLVILLSHIPVSPKCPVGENNYSIASGWQISRFL